MEICFVFLHSERRRGVGRDKGDWKKPLDVAAALTSAHFAVTNLQNRNTLRPIPGLLVRKPLIIMTGILLWLGKCRFPSHSAFLNKTFKNTTKEKSQLRIVMVFLETYYTNLSYGSVSFRLSLKNWCFRPVVLEKTLESPLDSRRSNQSILKEINLEYSLEGLLLKLKLWYLATWCKELTYWKRPWCWERLKAGGEWSGRGWDR